MNKEKGVALSAASLTVPVPSVRDDLSGLFREHYRRVLTGAYRITGNMADAEDVAQAVFLRLASGDATSMSNAGSYLYRSAINGALDLLRKRNHAEDLPIDEAAGVVSTGLGSSPEREVSNQQLGRFLRQAIGELAPRAAEMFVLRYIEDLGNREVAGLMGTSQAVVAVTLHQARSRLKKRLMQLERESL